MDWLYSLIPVDKDATSKVRDVCQAGDMEGAIELLKDTFKFPLYKKIVIEPLHQ